MRNFMIYLSLIICSIVCVNQFSYGQETVTLDNSKLSDETLSYYENSYVNPSKELLSIFKNQLTINHKEQVELRKIIVQGNNLKQIIKGEFEKEDDYEKRVKKYNENLNKIKATTSSLEKLSDHEEILNIDISLLEEYISKFIQPKYCNDKLSSISHYDSEDESFIVEFNGRKYWIHIPIAVAPEFKSNYTILKVIKFFDKSLRIEFNSNLYGLHNEEKSTNNYLGVDGKPINWVRIGNQIWMSENMKINFDKGSWAYNNDESNVAKYGRLYNWSTAANACSNGWHLPTDAEWNQLENYIKEDKNVDGKIGYYLKTKSGWENSYSNGIDAYGFSGFPGGQYKNGAFVELGYYGYWWTTYEVAKNIFNEEEEVSMLRYLRYNKRYLIETRGNKENGFSIRCIKD